MTESGCLLAGQELYMLPAIDMINHATEPEKRNTVLRRSTAEATVKVDGADVNIKGFFTMKAGQASMLCNMHLLVQRMPFKQSHC